MRYLIYSEMTEDDGHIEVKRSESEAIEWMQKHALEHHYFRYQNEQDALDDYIALHWAFWVEEL
jgi:hypothetical protein